MLKIEWGSAFKRDMKLAKRRGKRVEYAKKIMDRVAREETLEPRLRDHALGGCWAGHRELHIEPDWLLIYQIHYAHRIVVFVRTGTHSDLFR